MRIYEIDCQPPNEQRRIIRLEARSIEEAMQRANALWMHQVRSPRLLCIIDPEPQQALAFS